MDLGLRDRRVLVTGATRGIGKAVALAFGAEGAKVAITYNSAADEAAKVVAQLGGEERSFAVPYDLRDMASIDAAVDAVNDRWGGVDVLVANALYFTWEDPATTPTFENTEADEWGSRLRANVDGTIRTAQLALRGMRERKWGRIVILSSTTAHNGLPGSEIYSASKAAMHGFARGAMWGGEGSGVLVNVVAPGLTLTESAYEAMAASPITKGMADHELSITPSGRLSDPEDIARLIVFLGSEANGNVTGEVVRTAGGR
jgi:3-oxoacyl-[acyl-carrier protein] reductase